jgi:periplasmic divalent cation tolerance protein
MMAHDAGSDSLLEGDTIVELRTTFSAHDRAAACARRLVEGRFAACVQIEGPVTSVYRWQGAVELAEEFRCTCKTSVAGAAACAAAILAAHDYEIPELIAATVHASPAYAAWVRAMVRTGATGQNEGDAATPP